MKWLFRNRVCSEERIALLVSGCLPEREQAEVQRHIQSCTICKTYHQEFLKITGALKDWETNAPSIQPSQTFQKSWKKAVTTTTTPILPKRDNSSLDLVALFRALILPNPQAWTGLAALWI